MNKKTRQSILIVLAALILGISGCLLILHFEERPVQNDLEQKHQMTPDPDPLPDTVVYMPKDPYFEKAIVAEFDNAQRIADYINKHFVIEGQSVHKKEHPYTPLEFFQKRRGEEQDFAIFAAYILDRNRYETVVFQYRFRDREDGEEGLQTLVIFRGADVPKYMVLTDLGIEIFAHGWSFEDLLRKEEQRLNIKIYQYALFRPGIFNLRTDEWIERRR